ncbi:MAG: cytochrome b, partial [Pseudomonadota bacterium]
RAHDRPVPPGPLFGVGMTMSCSQTADSATGANKVVSSRRYTHIAIALHWIIAVSIIAMLAMGVWMVDAIKQPDTQALAFQTYQFHKSLGLTIIILSLARLGWRLLNPPPPLPAHMPRFQKATSHATHMLFYALMIGMPLTGWAMVSASPLGLPTIVFGWFEWPHIAWLEAVEDKAAVAERFKLAHMYAGYLMIGLVVLHIAAALKHQFVDRDNLIARMSPLAQPPKTASNAPTTTDRRET